MLGEKNALIADIAFSKIVQVGTPGLVDRCRRLESKLDAAGLSKAIQPAFDPKLQALVDVPAAELARNLLNERYKQDHVLNIASYFTWQPSIEFCFPNSPET